MDNKLLKKLQNTELDILDAIHAYCKAHQIRYSLFYGTAIGAVRHQGFIPWDDDVDIVMTRENYKKFCKIWETTPMQGYFLQNTERDLRSGINHAKIRKDNTILLSKGENPHVGHHGVWVDIFILDKVPEDPKQERFIRKNAYKCFLLTRANAYNTAQPFGKRLLKRALRLIPQGVRKKRLEKAEAAIQRFADMEQGYFWMSLSCPEDMACQFPMSMTEHYHKVLFEEQEFYIFDQIEAALRIIYGDFMKLPPAEEQICKHMPVQVKL